MARLRWFKRWLSPSRPNAADAADTLAELERQAELHLAQGDHAAVVQRYRDILTIRPESAQTHARLGVALNRLGLTDQARHSAERALALDTSQVEARCLLAAFAQSAGNMAAAHEHYAHAVAAAPMLEDPYLDWCRLLFQEGRLDDAAALVEGGLLHMPRNVHLHVYLGNLRYAQGRFEEAVDECLEALRMLPDNPSILTNLSQAQLMAGHYDAAAATLRRVLDLEPENAVARYSQGHLALLLGDLGAGWAGFEMRDRLPGMAPNPTFPQPLFSLEADVAGKTVLLHGEQGYGDTLQFIRYAALIAARGARVIAAVHKPLATLVVRSPGVAAVADADNPQSFDYYSPLLSLPGIFKTDLSNIPRSIPYLSATPERAAHWRAMIGERTMPRVGLAWSGNPFLANRNDAMRSIRFEKLLPILALPGIEFHSLQVGDEAVAQIGDKPNIVDHSQELFDFQETAALIEQLDLVISVDTAVAHLAGGLGKPIWLLNRYNGCWRWMLDRSDSPWYPSMRIFRQSRFGDWDCVVNEVRDALAEFARLPPRN